MTSDIKETSTPHDYYDYVAYVDASGDDGYKFGPKGQGSSRCYAVAMFVVKREDIEFNEAKLDEIKKLVGCKPEHELKYSVLRRHRKSTEIHDIVSDMKGTIVSWIAFKEEITDPYYLDLENKALSQVCHIFPINSVNTVLGNETGSNIFIAVDVMKKIEMDGVRTIVENSFENSTDESPINNYDLKFKDSKDKHYQLIQAADIFAGIIRNSFESWPLNHEAWLNCMPCNSLINIKKNSNLCRYKNKNIHLENSNNLFKIMPLFLKKQNYRRVILAGITPFPLELSNKIDFIDCLLNKEYTLRTTTKRIKNKRKSKKKLKKRKK